MRVVMIETKENAADAERELVLKGLEAFEIKDAEQGLVEAVIATLDVVDRDGDVITADAIKSGAKVKMSGYGHDAVWGATPVGKGTIRIDGNKAIFSGKVFLATARGQEIFNVLKEMGSDQEWSFGFRVKGSEVPDESWQKKGARRVLTKVDAFEVSPVMIGAGVGTRTVGVKEAAEETPVTVPPVVVTPPVVTPASDADAAAADAKRVKEEAETKAVAAAAAARDEFARFERTRRRFG